jgi:hypothetical protein
MDNMYYVCVYTHYLQTPVSALEPCCRELLWAGYIISATDRTLCASHFKLI